MMLKVRLRTAVLYQFGFLTDHFAPEAVKFMFFNTREMLNSPLCPGGRGGRGLK